METKLEPKHFASTSSILVNNNSNKDTTNTDKYSKAYYLI